jgi:hypothetical protein
MPRTRVREAGESVGGGGYHKGRKGRAVGKQ